RGVAWFPATRTTRAMLRESAIDPVALLREARHVEFGKSRGHLAGAQPGLPDELVGRRRQEVEQRPAFLLDRRRRRLEPQRLENVARRSQRRGPETEQRICSRRQCRRDLARDREHLSPLLEREVRSDQRTASLTRLDDNR